MGATLDRAGYSIHYQAMDADRAWNGPPALGSTRSPLEDAIDELAGTSRLSPTTAGDEAATSPLPTCPLATRWRIWSPRR